MCKETRKILILDTNGKQYMSINFFKPQINPIIPTILRKKVLEE